MSTPDYFARIHGSVNFPLLQSKRVVIVGVGMVGSPIAEELAKCGVGHLRLIDHDILERANLSRHVLTDEYLGWNKAEGLTVYLAQHVEGLQIEAVPCKIDRSVSNDLLDQWLADADIIIASTDDHEAQRRVGQHALALGIPSIFPALYIEGGGEVIVQLDDQLPCFSCWDEFRPHDAPLRGAQALGFIALPVIYTSLRISLGLLDPASPDREIMRAGRTRPPYQTFGLNRVGTLLSGHLTQRPDCPVCSTQSSSPPPTQTAPPTPPVAAVSQQGPRYGVIALIAVAILVAIVIGLSHSSPSASVPEGVNAAAGKDSRSTQSEPPAPATRSDKTGRSVATALPITPGAPEVANSGAVAYDKGRCGPEKGQFWKIALHQGEKVTITWGGPGIAAGGIDIWTPGITDIHGSDERRVTYQSTEGAEESELKFAAPTTGEYPIVIDDNCGRPVHINFILTIRPG